MQTTAEVMYNLANIQVSFSNVKYHLLIPKVMDINCIYFLLIIRIVPLRATLTSSCLEQEKDMIVALSTTLADGDKKHTCVDSNRSGDIKLNNV